jgi:hypothetical protein
MDAKILGPLIMRYPGVQWRNEIIKQMKNTGITIPPQLSAELAKISPSIMDIWWENNNNLINNNNNDNDNNDNDNNNNNNNNDVMNYDKFFYFCGKYYLPSKENFDKNLPSQEKFNTFIYNKQQIEIQIQASKEFDFQLQKISVLANINYHFKNYEYF